MHSVADLHINGEKIRPEHPDLIGSVTVESETYAVALWNHLTRDGQREYYSGVLNKDTCCCEQFDDGPELPMPFKNFATEVSRNCLTSISRASIVFAWLDDLSAYGSFAELGFAHALGKPIWLAWSKPLPELWFVQQMATEVLIAENASLAFRELLFTQLDRSLL